MIQKVQTIKVNPSDYWSRDVVRDIRAKSQIGRYRVRGYGAFKRVPTFDDLTFTFDPGKLSAVDNITDKVNLHTTLGSRYAKRPIENEIPISLSAMSYGALSKSMKIALGKASALAGTSTNTGEGGMLPEDRAAAKHMIYQMLPGRFGFNIHDIRRADAVEIYISQGAKPGLGGQLMAAKVTDELARIRGIPKGIDLRSPSRHPDILGADDLVIKIEELREATRWEVPISIKIGAGHMRHDIQIAVKDMVDMVAIDGMQGGTGAAPEVVLENIGIPSLAAIVESIDGVEQMGRRDDVTLMLMGGIKDGVDAAKALALGADAVAIGTSALLAGTCIACVQCHSNKCPTGITTHKNDLEERYLIDRNAEWIATFLRNMAAEVAAITLACGKDNCHDLARSDLRALTPEASATTGVPMFDTGKVYAPDATDHIDVGN
jgi:glutamate synthase domain-containing protein 2